MTRTLLLAPPRYLNLALAIACTAALAWAQTAEAASVVNAGSLEGSATFLTPGPNLPGFYETRVIDNDDQVSGWRTAAIGKSLDGVNVNTLVVDNVYGTSGYYLVGSGDRAGGGNSPLGTLNQAIADNSSRPVFEKQVSGFLSPLSWTSGTSAHDWAGHADIDIPDDPTPPAASLTNPGVGNPPVTFDGNLNATTINSGTGTYEVLADVDEGFLRMGIMTDAFTNARTDLSLASLTVDILDDADQVLSSSTVDFTQLSAAFADDNPDMHFFDLVGLEQTQQIQISFDGAATPLAGINAITFDHILVPEPSAIAIWSLIGLGLAGFGIYRRRRVK